MMHSNRPGGAGVGMNELDFRKRCQNLGHAPHALRLAADIAATSGTGRWGQTGCDGRDGRLSLRESVLS
jgi:hypothetical protein